MADFDRLIPVEEAGDHYTVSREWLMADLPFPLRRERSKLIERGFLVKAGVVHYENAALEAAIYFLPDVDEQMYADVLQETEKPAPPGALPVLDAEQVNRYIASLRNAYEFSEGVLPEQRLHIESQFIEPILHLNRRPSENVPWNGLRDHNYLMIMGAAGSGKTTLLRQWILELATKLERGEEETIPLCLQLRDLRPGESLMSAVQRSAVDSNAEWLSKDWMLFAERGQVAFAFDGIDEVPVEDRGQLIDQLREFTSTYRRCRFMMTSRPSVDVRLDIGLERAQIRPFDAPRMRQLAHYKLYSRGGWERFSSRLESEPAYDAVAGNPLAYTFILAKYIHYSVPPSYVAELTSGLVDLLVDSWDSTRGITRARSHRISPGTAIRMLSFLASELQRKGQLEVNSRDLDQALAHLVPDMSIHQALRMVADHSGIIRHSQTNGWQFSHRLYFDYFSAHAQVSSLTSGLRAFAARLKHFSSVAASTVARVVGYLSSDGSDAIARTLQTAAPGDLTVSINLAYLLSQRMPVSDAVLSGFTNLTLATLSQEFEAKRVEVVDFGKSGRSRCLRAPGALADTDGIEPSLASLLQAIYLSRDGVGGEALRAALRSRSDPKLVEVADMLSLDGIFTSSQHGEFTVWFVDRLRSEPAPRHSKTTGEQ